jgi:hypothetical protein
MAALSDVLSALFVVCVATPIWYLPYRWLRRRIGKREAGPANIIDWLNATGIGIFLAALIGGLVQTL